MVRPSGTAISGRASPGSAENAQPSDGRAEELMRWNAGEAHLVAGELDASPSEDRADRCIDH